MKCESCSNCECHKGEAVSCGMEQDCFDTENDNMENECSEYDFFDWDE